MKTFKLYVKDMEAAPPVFVQFVGTGKKTPYIFDAVSGKLEVDLTLAEFDHVLKVVGTGPDDATTTSTNEFKSKSSCDMNSFTEILQTPSVPDFKLQEQ